MPKVKMESKHMESIQNIKAARPTQLHALRSGRNNALIRELEAEYSEREINGYVSCTVIRLKT